MNTSETTRTAYVVVAQDEEGAQVVGAYWNHDEAVEAAVVAVEDDSPTHHLSGVRPSLLVDGTWTSDDGRLTVSVQGADL